MRSVAATTSRGNRLQSRRRRSGVSPLFPDGTGPRRGKQGGETPPLRPVNDYPHAEREEYIPQCDAYRFASPKLHYAISSRSLTPVYGRFRRRRYSARALARVRGGRLRSTLSRPFRERPPFRDFGVRRFIAAFSEVAEDSLVIPTISRKAAINRRTPKGGRSLNGPGHSRKTCPAEPDVNVGPNAAFGGKGRKRPYKA